MFTANDKTVRALSYEIGGELSFSLSDSSGMEYTICGMNDIEDWGTWPEENIVFQMKLDSKSELLHCEIEASAFNDVQDVTVSVNNQMVYKNLEYRGEGIKFDFVNPGEGNVLQISVDIPNAATPKDLGISGDTRVLGLGFFNEWNEKRDHREEIYISYDSASKNCQAGDIEMVEYGHPKDNKGLPVFNYSIAYGTENKGPLFYEQYPGSVVDIS